MSAQALEISLPFFSFPQAPQLKIAAITGAQTKYLPLIIYEYAEGRVSVISAVKNHTTINTHHTVSPCRQHLREVLSVSYSYVR